VRHANIEENEIEEILLQLSFPEELDHGQAQALLIDLGHPASHAAGNHPTDIGMVRDIAHEADEGAAIEDRHRHVDVGEMCPARDVRIVRDEDVAILDIATKILQQMPHQPGHRRYMDGQGRFRLRDQTAIAVADHRRMITALFNVGGICTFHQCDECLVCDGAQAVCDDLDRDRIDCRDAPFHFLTVMRRFMTSSTRRLSFG
jgi:hypothetical protein